METITLFLTPEFDTIRDEMGYDENDEFYILDEGEDVFEKEDFQTETLREGQYRYDAAENIFWKINDEPSDLSF